jgi:hypothetical protein
MHGPGPLPEMCLAILAPPQYSLHGRVGYSRRRFVCHIGRARDPVWVKQKVHEN